MTNAHMPIARAMAAGLRLDERSRLVGEIDGRNGVAWQCPDHLDLLAYSLGHAAGSAERACGGGRAQPGETP